jgi:SAM-dependent methyltransferase
LPSYQHRNHRTPISLPDTKYGERLIPQEPIGLSRPSRSHDSRPLDYYTGRRTDVVSMIPAGTRSVIEVGCAAGETGRVLREQGVEYLIGIDINPDIALMSRPHYSRLVVGDAEEIDLTWISPESIDCILYPDVLEHFRDPWRVLKRHLSFVKKGGYVVASIPNVRYYKAVQDLVIRGTWKYDDAGILDRGHLRFFTLKSIRELFQDSGCTILTTQQNARGSHVLKFLNRLVFNRLQPFLVKQYRILAQKT